MKPYVQEIIELHDDAFINLLASSSDPLFKKVENSEEFKKELSKIPGPVLMRNGYFFGQPGTMENVLLHKFAQKDQHVFFDFLGQQAHKQRRSEGYRLSALKKSHAYLLHVTRTFPLWRRGTQTIENFTAEIELFHAEAQKYVPDAAHCTEGEVIEEIISGVLANETTLLDRFNELLAYAHNHFEFEFENISGYELWSEQERKHLLFPHYQLVNEVLGLYGRARDALKELDRNNIGLVEGSTLFEKEEQQYRKNGDEEIRHGDFADYPDRFFESALASEEFKKEE